MKTKSLKSSPAKAIDAEKMLRGILDNAPGNIVLLDPQYKVICFNEAMKMTLVAHFTDSIKVGDDYRRFVREPLMEHFLNAFSKAIRGEITDIELQTVSDLAKWYHFKMTPVYDVDHSLLGVSFTAMDIDDRKKAQDALKERESQLEAFFDNVEGPASLIDNQKRYVLFNRKFADVYFDLSSKTISEGREVYATHSDPIKAERHALLDRVLEGKSEVTEIAHLKNGKQVYYRTSFTPVVKDGIITGISMYSTDLTEIRESEAALRERMKELATIYRINAILQDENCALDDIFARMLEVIPSGWQYPDECGAKIKFDNKEYTTGNYKPSAYSQSAAIKTQDDKEGSIEVVYSSEHPLAFEGPFLKEERELLDTVVEIFTVHYNKRIYFEGLKTLNEELELRVKERTEDLEAFSYSVSHDLRAPLRAISGYAKMFEDMSSTPLDAQEIRLLKVIQDNAHRMGTLIDDLLAFSKLGRQEVSKSAINMSGLIERILADLKYSGNILPDIRVKEILPVMGDSALLHQVLTNLIGNAVKYSSKSQNPVVSIESKQENEEIIYSVADNGVGFDMQYADKLFGVFQRLHSQGEFPGTGVGLAIAEKVIRKHRGRIWAEAAPGVGATFYFALPLL